ncbi:MAG TPA: hypothetical protein VK996_19275 [Ramlibacter sp.]|nr:hypothetical protein [Ramlibacter sp.]
MNAFSSPHLFSAAACRAGARRSRVQAMMSFEASAAANPQLEALL